MPEPQLDDASQDNELADRTRVLFDENRLLVFVRTDRFFALLMVLQWAGAILIAITVSPRTWAGTVSYTHIHVWVALLLGGLITSLPVCLALFRSGRTSTRHVIAIGQMLMSALLIHLSGGRIETHFHVFGSLAFLAFYRDWRVLITGSIVVAIDHAVRGVFWPQSVYGVLAVEPWRWVEHTSWVVFEDIFLAISIKQSLQEMWELAKRQAQLEKTNRLVEAKVEERTVQLMREVVNRKGAEAMLAVRAQELSRSNAELQQFAYVAAHDLREPLRTIISYTNLLAEEHQGKLTKDAEENMAFIVDAGKRMQQLISDLLTYSRIDSKAKPFVLTDCEVVFDQTVANLKTTIEEVKGEITHDPLPAVMADASQFSQLLLNLLGNALKFKGDGPPHIHVSGRLEEGGKQWLFSVKDNGIGIDSKSADRVFQMFQRLHSMAEYSGTGIGLAVCKKIVERHGGRIWFESTPGQGTEFFFTIPVRPVSPAAT